MNWVEVGRFLIVAGTVIIVVGLLFVVADKIPLNKFDLQIGSGKFKVYIPVGTSILLSIAITLILNFFSKR